MENSDGKIIPLATRRLLGWKSPKEYTEKGADGKMHGREVIIKSNTQLERKANGMIGLKSEVVQVADTEVDFRKMRKGGLFIKSADNKVTEMRGGKDMPDIFRKKSVIGGVVVGDDPFRIDRPGGSKRIPANRAMGAYSGWVYAAVSAIAMDIATIQWRLFQVNDTDDHEEIFEHEVLDLLEGVNEFQTGIELRFLMASHLELAGNCYLLKMDKNKKPVANDSQKPAMLYPLDPGGMTMVFDKTQFPYILLKYIFQYDGKKHSYEPFQILHLKYPDPSDMWSGVGPVQTIAPWIDNDMYATEYNRRFFLQGAHIDGVLQSEMTAEETIDVLRTSWEIAQEGIENAHKTPVLPKGVKYVPTSATPKEMDFASTDDRNRDKILAGFKVSKTILGTAESDTNRATAETADYVFAKRTIRPKMELICAYLNEFLIPLFGDKIYISYENPVPEDSAARSKEMQMAVGSSPVLSTNEAREEYMGLGPVEGGDVVLALTTLQPLGGVKARPSTGGGGAGKEDADEDEDEDEDNPDGKAQNHTKKTVFPRGVVKRHVGRKITRGAQNLAFRKSIGSILAERVAQSLADQAVEQAKRGNINEMSHADYASVYKEFLVRVDPYEKKINDLLVAINKNQKAEVMQNLESATGVKKDIDPTSLFNLKKWVDITIDALTPVLIDLGNKEGAAAAELVGKPLAGSVFDEPAAQTALDEAVNLMAQSYNETVLDALKATLDQGIRDGLGYQQLAEKISDIYEFQDEKAALRVARTESVRVANMTTKAAWKETGVVKTVKWYTAEDDTVCPYCQAEDGKEIGIDQNFYNLGDDIPAAGDMPSITNDYSDIGGPPLHPNCRCYIRPEVINSD